MKYRSDRILPDFRLILFRFLVASLALFQAACTATPTPNPTPTPIPLAKEITLYDWAEDTPRSVLAAFTAEYGVKVNYLAYESQEEAIANMQAGKVYDIVVMESRFIPQLVRENLLADLDQRNLPNSKNISANFRDLAYDPDNRYSIPYTWGATGLVVRSDLVDEPVRHWGDLWDPRYAGRNALCSGQPREVIGLTLKSLGYSVNSEKPEELHAALARLLEIRSTVIQIEDLSVNLPGMLADGKVVVSMGYSYEAITGQTLNPAITYVFPAEGALLWNDTFIIPKNSPNQYTAELFLNFLMRPEINAMIANENLYATPNEAAFPFIDTDILKNAVIFPSKENLTNAELILPLSPQGQELYDSIWERFLAAP
jgi:spermidine/putrescine transport system substrate-binding protein